MTGGKWPDASRPGVPLTPERDGHHWLTCPGVIPASDYPVKWYARSQKWAIGGRRVSPDELIDDRPTWMPAYAYVGPCLTPDDHAAAVNQARTEGEEAGLRKAAAILNKKHTAYHAEHGSQEPDTGAWNYPGDGAESMADWEETEEAILALIPAVAVPEAGA